MRTRTLFITILTLTVWLGVASCGDDDASQADPTLTSPAVTHSLSDSNWLVVAVVEDDVAHPPPSADLGLAFQGSDAIRADLGCNGAAGAYVADQNAEDKSGSIAIADLAWTEMACMDVEDWQLLAEALTEATTWSIGEDNSLTLQGPRLAVAATFNGYDDPSGTDEPTDPGEGVTSPTQ